LATLEELLKEQKRVQRDIEITRNREIKGVVKRILPAIAKYNIPIEMLYPNLTKQGKPRKIGLSAAAKKATKKTAKKVAPLSGKTGTKPAMYKDPETGKTWSGFGHEPGWMKGKKREDFLIKK